MFCKIEKIIKRKGKHQLTIGVYGDAPKVHTETVDVTNLGDKEMQHAISLVIEKMQGQLGVDLAVRSDFKTTFSQEGPKDDEKVKKLATRGIKAKSKAGH